MKNKNKYQKNQRVRLKSTGEIVTIVHYSYVANMKRYSYTLSEYPQTFYFEEEIEAVEE
ncbi:hypothetical protein [Bacillus solitudinis]|uniref:hypothetical protein n=1 Tax=Bacillus solitudinis TaxID=2014074 RepID=UPI0018E23120|nr:hypothetical protein [Bacillus solitudinis]